MSKSRIAPNIKSLIIYAIMGIIAISSFLFLDAFKVYERGDLFGWSVWGGEPMIDTLYGYKPLYISSIFCLLGIVFFIVGCFKAKSRPQSILKWTVLSVFFIYVYIFINDGNTYEWSYRNEISQYIIQLSYDSLGFILYLITSTIWLITSLILSIKQK